MSISNDDGVSSVYRFTGEVVSPAWIDDSLDGAVILVYEREKVRDLSTEEITTNVRDYVEDMVTDFEYILKGEQVPSTADGEGQEKNDNNVQDNNDGDDSDSSNFSDIGDDLGRDDGINEVKGTPGFEIIVLIFSIFLLIHWRRVKYKKK